MNSLRLATVQGSLFSQKSKSAVKPESFHQITRETNTFWSNQF